MRTRRLLYSVEIPDRRRYEAAKCRERKNEGVGKNREGEKEGKEGEGRGNV
jgi:tRNA U34 5-methylaminomethyl-2-thiouridine-forming methyltransferase MnmC